MKSTPPRPRTRTFGPWTWNLMHMALQLHEADGAPAHGNQRSEWKAGCRFDHPTPDGTGPTAQATRAHPLL